MYLSTEPRLEALGQSKCHYGNNWWKGSIGWQGVGDQQRHSCWRVLWNITEVLSLRNPSRTLCHCRLWDLRNLCLHTICMDEICCVGFWAPHMYWPFQTLESKWYWSGKWLNISYISHQRITRGLHKDHFGLKKPHAKPASLSFTGHRAQGDGVGWVPFQLLLSQDTAQVRVNLRDKRAATYKICSPCRYGVRRKILNLGSDFLDTPIMDTHTMRTGLPRHVSSRIHMQELFRKLKPVRYL